MKALLKKIFVVFISIVFVYACNKNDSELTFGEDYVDSETGLTLIDTVTVEFSTVKIDSIETSNTNTLLVGYENDLNFGEVIYTSYFEINTPGEIEISDQDVYDSVVLILNYSNYYGDTTVPFSLNVHQLTEEIEYNDDGGLTNMSHVSFNPQHIGNKQFLPKPNKKDSLVIRISDEIGSYLFKGLQDNIDDVINNYDFVESFKGLALEGSNSSNKAILGFNSETISLRVFSHGFDLDEPRQYDFSFSSSSRKFTQIKHNYSNTTFSAIESQRDDISAKVSDGLSFLQSGTGLLTKITFPGLRELLLMERKFITKAELIFAPKKSTYKDRDLPKELVIYKADKYNNLDGQLALMNGNVATTILNQDDLYNENTFYSINISSYIIDGITNNYFDENVGLLIGFNPTEMVENYNKVLIDTKEFEPKLKLYLLNY